MKYAEQIKYSWSYHWGIFREIWDRLTGELHWWIVGLLVILCVLPTVFVIFTPATVIYYATTPAPAFSPSFSQELAITEYCQKVGREPLFFWALNYFWTRGSGFDLLANTLCLMSMGLLLGAYLREGEKDEKA